MSNKTSFLRDLSLPSIQHELSHRLIKGQYSSRHNPMGKNQTQSLNLRKVVIQSHLDENTLSGHQPAKTDGIKRRPKQQITGANPQKVQEGNHLGSNRGLRGPGQSPISKTIGAEGVAKVIKTRKAWNSKARCVSRLLVDKPESRSMLTRQNQVPPAGHLGSVLFLLPVFFESH